MRMVIANPPAARVERPLCGGRRRKPIERAVPGRRGLVRPAYGARHVAAAVASDYAFRSPAGHRRKEHPMAVQRDTPYPGFNFLVDLGDGETGGPQAGFQEVGGIGT